MKQELSEQEIIRREHLEELKKMGIDPFPAEEVELNFNSKSMEEKYQEGKLVILAGRIMSKRIMGKASFVKIQDEKGVLQAYFNRDEICSGEDKTQYNTLFKKLLDIGDIIAIWGRLFTTKVGEKSVAVSRFKILSKSLKPLPLPKTDMEGKVHDAFTDTEMRYRQRYADLIVNPENKKIFSKRSALIKSMRTFFDKEGYMEVETPVLQPIPGGATARPFITLHNAMNTNLYLRIANELYLKRLIVGGYEGVYEFSRNFRNEGMDRTHNPEFTAMEIYVAYKDYLWMMRYTEQLLEQVSLDVNGDTKILFGDVELDFKAPYKRVTMRDSIKEFTGFDIKDKTEEALRTWCVKNRIQVDSSMGKGKLIDEIFGSKCEKNYIQPTFIMDYPIEMSPLTKQHRKDPSLTERFELIVCGKEIANAYSELNDPIDQQKRFESQLKLAKRGDKEAMYIDYDFLRALSYGMPPTSGLGIGIDRLIMFFTNQQSIQEVLFFPQMKPEN